MKLLRKVYQGEDEGNRVAELNVRPEVNSLAGKGTSFFNLIRKAAPVRSMAPSAAAVVSELTVASA